MYSFINKFWVSSKCPAWWAGPGAQKMGTTPHSALLLTAITQPQWCLPTGDGGFSQPHGKCHGLKLNISLGWNLMYFSNVICMHSYSLCHSAWHRETRDQSKSFKSHKHMLFPLNTYVQLALITTNRVHWKFWIHWPHARLSNSELWHSQMRLRRWGNKVAVHFKHLTLLLFRVAKFRTKRSFYTSMRKVHSSRMIRVLIFCLNSDSSVNSWTVDPIDDKKESQTLTEITCMTSGSSRSEWVLE